MKFHLCLNKKYLNKIYTNTILITYGTKTLLSLKKYLSVQSTHSTFYYRIETENLRRKPFRICHSWFFHVNIVLQTMIINRIRQTQKRKFFC